MSDGLKWGLLEWDESMDYRIKPGPLAIRGFTAWFRDQQIPGKFTESEAREACDAHHRKRMSKP